MLENCIQQNTFTIYTGDEKTMNLKAAYAENLDPLDLTSCTEIDVSLPNEDGTFKHILLSTGGVSIVSPSLLGKFNALIHSADSALLNIGEFQDFTVAFTILGVRTTVKYFKGLTVLES